MSQQELTDEQEDVIRKVESLLRLATKNPNQNEAIAANAKAQEMLAKYNLDMAIVEANSGASSGRREDSKVKGGLYHYQRDLWQAVAELNFCLYWNMYTFDKDKSRVQRRKVLDYSTYEHKIERTRVQGGYRFEHRVVGRMVNVRSTRVMAEYLEQTIERLTRERLNGDGSQFFTRWATSFREGVAEEVIDKIYERRKQLLAVEKQKAREVAKRAAEAATKGLSTATTLTISDVVKAEHDANIDFVYGEGTSARWADQAAKRAAAEAKAEREYVAWAKANPEEARELEEKERKRRRSYGSRDYKDRKSDNRDWGAYKAGEEVGRTVGIDPQTDERRAVGRIGR